MKMKTIRDLAAEMRTLADDIEAAAEREREEAEAAGLAAGGMVEAARHAPPNPGGAAPSAPVGNTAAMREALEYLCSISDLDLSELEVLGNRLEDTSTYGGGLVLKLVHGVRNGQKALAKPPRNCDVGTAQEQAERFVKHCQSFLNRDGIKACMGCPCCGVVMYGKCEFAWAQMPYEKGDAK